MNEGNEVPDFLTTEQEKIIGLVRDRLLTVHNVDTSSLNQIEMTARMAVLVKIAKARQMDDSQLCDVLDELGDKFMDFNALVKELAMCAGILEH